LRRDLAFAAAGLALAAAYWWAANQLPTSMLSDAVGADGVPKALAVALAALSILVGLRVALRKDGEAPSASSARALGIAALGFLYVLLAPYIGYFMAITLLTAAAAVYYGAPRKWTVGAFALGTAGILWLMFGAMLGIPLP
jgi:putative tricarboxylic transport membrane protein